MRPERWRCIALDSSPRVPENAHNRLPLAIPRESNAWGVAAAQRDGILAKIESMMSDTKWPPPRNQLDWDWNSHPCCCRRSRMVSSAEKAAVSPQHMNSAVPDARR